MGWIALCLKLDEDRVRELLEAGAAGGGDSGMVGRLLGCYGDLFTTSMDMGWGSGAAAAAAGEGEEEAARKPRCMLTVASNEITRVRADIDSLVFQSKLPPRITVRLLHAVVVGLLLKFHSPGSYQLRFWDKVFVQLFEYLSKGSLDVVLCMTARGEMVGDRLRVVLQGDPSSNPHGLDHICPIHILNDVNLLTVLDSFKLATDAV
ncbi:MAG: hypothetical protein WDW38_010011 [Sanguina aurantia]